jgi:hypothetical protein
MHANNITEDILTLCWQSLWSRASSFTVVEDTPFYHEVPEHAYPTVYPPLKRSFPVHPSRYRFPKPSWERHPPCTPTPKDTNPDVSHITHCFGLLTLTASDDFVTCRKTDVMSPYLVQVYPAPLPCLIRRRRPQ